MNFLELKEEMISVVNVFTLQHSSSRGSSLSSAAVWECQLNGCVGDHSLQNSCKKMSRQAIVGLKMCPENICRTSVDRQTGELGNPTKMC